MKRSTRLVIPAALVFAAVAFGSQVLADDEGGGGAADGAAGNHAASPGRARGNRGADPQAGAALYAQNGCATCHGDTGGGGSGPSIQRASASRIFEAIREGEDGMPRFPNLGKRDVRDISAFLQDPTATTSPPPAPTPTPTPQPGPQPSAAPTWTGAVQAIFSQNCATCHHGKTAAAGVRLDTYAAASANASRSLSAIVAGRMPLGGHVAPADVQTISDWIAGGMPQ